MTLRERFRDMLVVDEYVWVLDPSAPMAGPIKSGERFVALTAPGCWGPMITPDFPAGHEVCQPVAVEGAEPGDAVVIHIESIRVLSRATTSGVHKVAEGHVTGAVPFVGKTCPGCGKLNPPTYVKGLGETAVRCQDCDTPIHACQMTAGYTVAFDDTRSLGITVGREGAEQAQQNPAELLALPKNSKQHPANLLATDALPGVVVRVDAMVGNIGTMPGCRIPSCQNSGDIAHRLVDDAHPMRISADDLALVTDSHLDDNAIVAGTSIIAPVRVPGAGVYLGDIHAMQSDGEVAGHTTDVTAEVVVRVELIKGVNLPGPLLLIPEEKLPEMIRPITAQEQAIAEEMAANLHQGIEHDALPLVAVGAAPDLRKSVDVAMQRLATIAGVSFDEVRNRVTISGCINIGRLTGTVHVGMRFPPSRLQPELARLLKETYNTSTRPTKGGRE